MAKLLRKFLKGAGAGLAALSALPFVGKFFKPAAKLAKSKSVVSALETTNATGMPEHFTLLVNKVLKEGKIKDATKTGKTHVHPDRKDIEVTVEKGGDEVHVAFETDAGSQGNYLWKKGETIPPSKRGEKGIKTVDEFTEGETGYWGKAGDLEPSKESLEEIVSGADNLDDFVGITKIKKASGGRVPLAGGGGIKNLLKWWKTLGKGDDVWPVKPSANQWKYMSTGEKELYKQKRIEWAETILAGLKKDKELIEHLGKTEKMGDPGLDFMMGKFRESFDETGRLGKYKNIDEDIMNMEMILKNMKMKCRKPQASGGLAYMLGE